MEITTKLLTELQKRLKIGNRRGVHLNAIPAKSKYKFDLNRLSFIDKSLPSNFINSLLTEQSLKFRISWKDNVPDLNTLFEADQSQLVKITKDFENLINQTEAIESEKGINTFGFGFPILVRRDKLDNKLTVSPIIIWSLRIKKNPREFNTWEILRSEDDSIYFNEILINHLQNDSNIEIEAISNEMLDDGLINKDELIEICDKLIQSINTSNPIDLKDTFKKNLENISTLGEKPYYEKLTENSANAFIDFGGLFSIFEVQKQNIINEYDNLIECEDLSFDVNEMVEHKFQPISSVQTDPSQQGILHSLQTSRNILIQGPPGTGKSQTLTAILVNALENHKKTIVVCEKITALEVLEKALKERELDFHFTIIRDIVSDRKAVVESVRERVDNSANKQYSYSYSKETLDNLIAKSKSLITSINNKHKKLDEKLLGNKTWSDIVGTLLAELKGIDIENNLNLEKNHFNYSSQELNNLLDLIQKGQSLYNSFKPFESSSFLNSEKLKGDNLYLIEQNINDDFEFYKNEINSIEDIFKKVKNEYIDLRHNELKNQVFNINHIIAQINSRASNFEVLNLRCRDNYFKFRNAELSSQLNSYNKHIENIFSIFNRNKNNTNIFNEKKLNGFVYNALSVFSKSKKKIISDYLNLQELFTQIENEISNDRDLDTVNFIGNIDSKMEVLQVFINTLKKVETNFEEKINKEYSDLKFDLIFDCEMIQEGMKNIDNIISNTKNISGNFSSLLSESKNIFSTYFNDSHKGFKDLEEIINNSSDIKGSYFNNGSLQFKKSNLLKLLADIDIIEKEFEAKIQLEFEKIDFLAVSMNNLSIASLNNIQSNVKQLNNRILTDAWSIENTNADNISGFLSNIKNIIETKGKYFEHENDLFTIEFNWFKYFNGLTEDNKKLITELKSKNNWRKSFLIHYLNSVLTNSANIDLPIDENEHIELERSLGGIEKEQLNYIREYWHSKQIEASRNFAINHPDLTAANLYRKKSRGKNIKLSLRQIVQFDVNLFTTFFPIILTTPDVCCNLFKGMNGYFDIVMFDEASQLRLEDNLPAILKGKQIIITGDEHQMPPSNYFSKVFDGSIENEDDIDEEDKITIDKDNILLSSESLLDFALELNFEKRHLDFHYRSKHPYLIDFSNYAFYNQRLKPLPNNFDYIPIKYIQVNGTFSEHTNDAEAEMVLSIVENNIHRLPNGEYPSVGIATFNIAQRNLIISKIDERRKFTKYKKFNEKIQELEFDNPKSTKSFIKNLENIQGDERDVIILSTTYGIGKDGKFAQRYGPINHSKGYKLLNVIITRAKYKVYVCSSIPEEVFMKYKEHLTLEESNNKRAVFYAYLAYCKAVSDKDNDLRLSVLTALSDNTSKNITIDSFRGDLESPFEEEVYQSLLENFGEEKLIPQLQFAGFRIDIVYDSKIEGIPKIAIECDGAKYHSSREAYLHDSYRQKILENHGFVFHRIWSTNWWRNSKRETVKLVNFIKNVESVSSNQFTDYSKTALAFTDEIESIENYIAQNSYVDSERSEEIIHIIEKKLIKQTQLFKDEIKMNNIVIVKYVNNGKDIKIQIVESKNDKVEISNGIQKININSPIASSILGRSVGDIVKIGNLDNFVEIIEITN